MYTLHAQSTAAHTVGVDGLPVGRTLGEDERHEQVLVRRDDEDDGRLVGVGVVSAGARLWLLVPETHTASQRMERK